MTDEYYSADEIKRGAIAMLKAGEASLAEMAGLIGTSRQLVRHWATRAGVDVTAARSRYLERRWRSWMRRV